MTLRGAVFLAVALAAAAPSRAAPPAAPAAPSPEPRGQVLLGAASARSGVAPVAFEHWRHRARFTCRLCHVDVGFAMEAGGSAIGRATNARGQHCGACHDGRRRFGGAVLFAACSASGPPKPGEACGRCHGGAGERSRADYRAFASRMPSRADGQVDWELAMARRLVAPSDLLDGLSVARPRMRFDRDVPFDAEGKGGGAVTFSHRKHAAWGGCELCHPELFAVAGSSRPGMAGLRAGQSCGACHRSVAFPLAECRRCHRGGTPG